MYGEFGAIDELDSVYTWVYTMFGLIGSTFLLFNLGIALMGGAYSEVTANWDKLEYACLCSYLL